MEGRKEGLDEKSGPPQGHAKPYQKDREPIIHKFLGTNPKTQVVSRGRTKKFSTIPELLAPFLHSAVVVRADGFVVKGVLSAVGLGVEHDGLGDLILDRATIVRGNMLLVLCTQRGF